MTLTLSNMLTLILVFVCAISVFGSIDDFGFPEAPDENVAKQNADVS